MLLRDEDPCRACDGQVRSVAADSVAVATVPHGAGNANGDVVAVVELSSQGASSPSVLVRRYALSPHYPSFLIKWCRGRCKSVLL